MQYHARQSATTSHATSLQRPEQPETFARPMIRRLVLPLVRAMKIPSMIAGWFRKGPSASERRLLQRCTGDQAKMERLIAYELQRRPELSRAQAAEHAMDRWNRDR